MDQRSQQYRACQSRSWSTGVRIAGSYVRLSALLALCAPPRNFSWLLHFFPCSPHNGVSNRSQDVTPHGQGSIAVPSCVGTRAIWKVLLLLLYCIGRCSLHSLIHIKKWRNFWVWAKLLEFDSLNWSAWWYRLALLGGRGKGGSKLYNLLVFSSPI